MTTTSFPPDLHDLMTRLVSSTSAQPSLDETLGWITAAARDTVPDVCFASISVRKPDGRFETLAPTDHESLACDTLQYELSEGPCIDAALGESVVRTNDVGSDPRWPAYGPQARSRAGIKAQLAFEMFSTHRSHGGLNLYSMNAGAFDDDTIALAQLFAMHGALAMGHAHTVSTMSDAMSTRQTIGQAVGLVMERYHLDDHRAFAFLVRLSQDGNVKLRDVAARVVGGANQEASDTGTLSSR